MDVDELEKKKHYDHLKKHRNPENNPTFDNDNTS
jgi:hypothetical protein